MPARKTTVEEQVVEPEVIEEEEALVAGEGSIGGSADAEPRQLYIWTAPGVLLVDEQQDGGIVTDGDVAVGTVAITHGDDEQYLGATVMYVPKRSPQLRKRGVSYAIVKVADMVGIVSHDPNYLTNRVAGTQRPGFEPEDLDLYRSSDQNGSGGSSAFGSAGPFDGL